MLMVGQLHVGYGLDGRLGRALNYRFCAGFPTPVAELCVEGDLAKTQEGEDNCHQGRHGAEQTNRHPTPGDMVIHLTSRCQLCASSMAVYMLLT